MSKNDNENNIMNRFGDIDINNEKRRNLLNKLCPKALNGYTNTSLIHNLPTKSKDNHFTNFLVTTSFMGHKNQNNLTFGQNRVHKTPRDMLYNASNKTKKSAADKNIKEFLVQDKKFQNRRRIQPSMMQLPYIFMYDNKSLDIFHRLKTKLGKQQHQLKHLMLIV